MNFIYLGFYVTFNTVQVISRWVVGRAEETSTYSSSGFCTVNCRPTASNYQLSHLRPGREPNPSLRGGKRECYLSATVTPIAWMVCVCCSSPWVISFCKGLMRDVFTIIIQCLARYQVSNWLDFQSRVWKATLDFSSRFHVSFGKAAVWLTDLFSV